MSHVRLCTRGIDLLLIFYRGKSVNFVRAFLGQRDLRLTGTGRDKSKMAKGPQTRLAILEFLRYQGAVAPCLVSSGRCLPATYLAVMLCVL